MFKEEWRSLLRSQYAQNESSLSAGVLHLIYEQRWFKMYLPEVLEGRDMDFTSILSLLEEIAYCDGSTGWLVTLCSGAMWFTGFMEAGMAREILVAPEACIAGSGSAGGRARITEKGYKINGFWKHNTGAPHATHFTANCILVDERGVSLKDRQGNERLSSFVFRATEVNLVPNWNYAGMLASGSWGMEVKDLEVERSRSFHINAEVKLATNVHNFPFLQLAEMTLAVNFLGMSRNFIRLAEEHHQQVLHKYAPGQRSYIEKHMRLASDELKAIKRHFYGLAQETQEEVKLHKPLSAQKLTELSYISRRMAHLSRELADRLFPYCGFEVISRGSELNRVWRDIHTASQHPLLIFP